MNRELAPGEVQLFFLVAVLVHVFPLVLADYLYIDDIWRAQFARSEWKTNGRILTEWLYQGLSLTRGVPNIFPLPLLISAAVISFAFKSMVFSLFEKPTLVTCFVVLPLWYCPLFLQNLSYQYDGPGMVLGLAATLFAVTYDNESTIRRIVVSGALICAGLSFYQIYINVYVGLCCVMFVRVVEENKDLKKVCAWGAEQFVKLVLGVIFYWLSAQQFMTDERKALLPLSLESVDKVVVSVKMVGEKISLFYSEGSTGLIWLLLTLAFVGFVQLLISVLRAGRPPLHNAALFVLCLCVVVVLAVSIPGISLVFYYFDDNARLLLGFSSALVFVFFLSYKALDSVHRRATIVLAIPLVVMLSLSYAYGRVVSAQKLLGTSVAQMLTYDLASNEKLKGVDRFYLTMTYQDHAWLPAATGTTHLIPVLEYILNINFLLSAEMVQRMGVAEVVHMENKDYLSVVDESKVTPVVNSRFYRVYVIGRTGYIRANTIRTSEHFN